MEKIEIGEYVPTKLEEGSELARLTEEEILYLKKAKQIYDESEQLQVKKNSLIRLKHDQANEEMIKEFCNKCDDILNNLGYRKLEDFKSRVVGLSELWGGRIDGEYYNLSNIEKNGYVIKDLGISLNKFLSGTGEITRINVLKISGDSELFERYFPEEFWRNGNDYEHESLDSPIELDSKNYDENIKKIYDELLSAF